MPDAPHLFGSHLLISSHKLFCSMLLFFIISPSQGLQKNKSHPFAALPLTFQGENRYNSSNLKLVFP